MGFSHKENDSVNKLAKVLLLGLGVLLVAAIPVFAAEDAGGGAAAGAAKGSLVELSKIGVGLVVIGAAYGIGRLASAAYEGMSRQPEVAGSIQTAMIIAAALIEGFTFYALYICST
jgi:F-type H+-transporting ATPase subunit c